ncbi:MAG: glycosyltransferase [Clostridiales bacterium]|nr:glycosyltransferase [Clostridiales bacterium]
MPKVSVIMGVYNAGRRENMLNDAVESILNQTFTDFEFIICNDGSNDNTKEILNRIQLKDKRIIIIENEVNKGLTYTLNRCLNECKGEYIARMDDDDISDKDRFKKQVNLLDSNKELGVIGINASLFDDSGIWGEKCYPEYLKKEDFLFTSPVTHPTIMARKECFELVKGYKEEWYTDRTEDYDLFMRMYASNVKFYTIQDKLFKYREDKNSYKKRKYKYRINETVVRMKGFKKLGLYPKGVIYVIKPLIVGLIPGFMMRKIHMKNDCE